MPVDLSNQILNIFLYNPEQPLLFNSSYFFIGFIIFYLVFIFIKDQVTIRTLYLFLFSVFFYYKSSGCWFWILLLSTVIDYSLVFAIDRNRGTFRAKWLLAASLISNLSILGYFKYTNFFLATGYYFLGKEWHSTDIFLPVGISFYTFQTLSYSIDIYRGRMKPVKSILDFGFFVAFFPQLVAGPIVRAIDFIPQIRKKIVLSDNDIGRGLALIIGGLFKKAVISDYISVNFVDRVFDQPALYSGFENLMAVYGYAVQIYCDFSGYSDMAIGLGLLMGFHLPENFRLPYQSLSLTDFWRRWHISLSSWLRDYLYYGLGGNRKGPWRTYINLLLTMLLGGLWHGANWKFVFWGAMHGSILAVEKKLATIFPSYLNPTRWWSKGLAWFWTFHFVCFCWIFFRATSFADAWLVLKRIALAFNPQIGREWLVGYPVVSALLVLGFFSHFISETVIKKIMNYFILTPWPLKSAVLAMTIWIVIQISSSEIVPFIYFQF